MSVTYQRARDAVQRQLDELAASHDRAKALAADCRAQGLDARDPNEAAHAQAKAELQAAVKLLDLVIADGALRARIKEIGNA
jgi:hypothetical protein